MYSAGPSLDHEDGSYGPASYEYRSTTIPHPCSFQSISRPVDSWPSWFYHIERCLSWYDWIMTESKSAWMYGRGISCMRPMCAQSHYEAADGSWLHSCSTWCCYVRSYVCGGFFWKFMYPCPVITTHYHATGTPDMCISKHGNRVACGSPSLVSAQLTARSPCQRWKWCGTSCPNEYYTT